MQPWSGFYAAIAGAAATLLGLLFVSVSFNATVILQEANGHARRFAEQAFQNYVVCLIVALLALIPSLSTWDFGKITLYVTALSGIWVLVRLYLALTRPLETGSRWQIFRRQALSVAGLGLLIFAAARLALHKGDTLNLLAGATVSLLVAATRSSWDLLLTLARARQHGADK